MLSDSQTHLLRQAGAVLQDIGEHRFCELCRHPQQIESAGDGELVAFLKIANALYRGGEPAISDSDYDFIFLAELKKRQPDHPLLHEVEPEPAFAGKTVDLPVMMLSTDKAYSRDEVERWAARIEKAAEELGKNFATCNSRSRRSWTATPPTTTAGCCIPAATAAKARTSAACSNAACRSPTKADAGWAPAKS
ncbi:hypothetical protein [Methylomonas koyamae]|uniref:hypothetical protein n=1 Tax=Methylomonas koyamae TaxID=702114 RepID=UPI000AD92D1F|nr:hypothetical protein [Methylomonas koyamae]